METIDALFDIVRTLRKEKGCPWDKKQTPQTMWKCLVEESYELQEALAKNDLPHICEELGDVLFQLIFIIEIFQETKDFTLSDIIDQVALKMIRRHPHVYKDANISTGKELNNQELNDQWAAIKANEKLKTGQKDKSVLDRVPRGMPSLMRALNVSKCAVKEGFDWNDIHGALKTVKDEIGEFEAALASKNLKEANLEFGDILFSLVNVARFAKIYPETALADATTKFESRFRIMEKNLGDRQAILKNLSRDEIDQAWEQAKKIHDHKIQDK
ncbi:MAG: nucleoside triphosphate pyrophosphohydrolase [Pseudomonadota bacterium]